MSLDRAAILNADDRQIEPVKVPQWRGSVCIRTLAGNEAEDLFRAARSQPGKPLAEDESFVVRLALCCMCDKQGVPLFQGDVDIKALGAKSWPALRIVFDAACELNGIGEEADKKLGKTSGTTTESDSGSD